MGRVTIIIILLFVIAYLLLFPSKREIQPVQNIAAPFISKQPAPLKEPEIIVEETIIIQEE